MCKLLSCGKSFAPERSRQKFCHTDCRIKFHTPVSTVGTEVDRYKDGPLKEAVLKQIIACYPSVPCARINMPNKYCTSGRNVLAELKLKYAFKYSYVHGSKRKFYDFRATEIEEFREILKEEQAATAAKNAGVVDPEGAAEV